MSELTALALNAAHEIPVAELHGAVCGLAVCHGEAMPVDDLVELVGVEALTDQAAVEQFVHASLADLEAADMSFEPLLPDDEVELADRLEALGQWCASFLAGLAAGLARAGVTSLEQAPEEVREIVADFSAISHIDPEAPPVDGRDRPEDDAEADYAELAEFVKVGALLIQSTFAHDPDDPPG